MWKWLASCRGHAPGEGGEGDLGLQTRAYKAIKANAGMLANCSTSVRVFHLWSIEGVPNKKKTFPGCLSKV